MGRTSGREISPAARIPHPLPQLHPAGRRRSRPRLPRQSGGHPCFCRGENARQRGTRTSIRRGRLRQTAPRGQGRHGLAALAQLSGHPLPLRYCRSSRHEPGCARNHAHPQRLSAAGVLRLLTRNSLCAHRAPCGFISFGMKRILSGIQPSGALHLGNCVQQILQT